MIDRAKDVEMRIHSIVAPSPPGNERLDALLKNNEGRRLVIVSGVAIREQFFLGKTHGNLSLIEGVTTLATQGGRNVVLWFDSSGVPHFSNPEMEQTFGLGLGPSPEAEDGWEDLEETESESPQGQSGQEQTASLAEVASLGRIHSTLDQIRNVCSLKKSVFAVFSEPEQLWMPGERDLTSQMSLLRQLAQLSIQCGPRLRLIMTVKPGRKAEFIRVLDVCETTDLIRQEIDLGPPCQRELERYLSRYSAANGIGGDSFRIATEWVSSGRYLYNLIEALNELRSCGVDFELDDVLRNGSPRESIDDVQADIDKLVGLQGVKDELQKMLKTIRRQAKERGRGRKQRNISTHMMFLGNPGTGKTEMARLVGRYLAASGIRSAQEPVEISRSDIASEYNRGQCIEKMNSAIQRAMGGVLFVDEAYQMASNEWMQEALETLMKAMEDHRESLTVIFAGYASEMHELWKVNPGFRSRIPHDREFVFPDYSPAELLEIFKRRIADAVGEPLTQEALDKAKGFIDAEVVRGRFGNARGVERRLVDFVLKERAAKETDGCTHITDAELPSPPQFNEQKVADLLKALDEKFVGLADIKKYFARISKEAQAPEMHRSKSDQLQRLHCKFLGPPGTGKTQVAQRVAQILHAMGLISDDKCLDVNPMSDLLSDPTGGLAQRVHDKFEEARGGVMFIDEAYQLAASHQGRLVVDQIVQRLTAPDFADTVVILAGYADRMDDLMACNRGLSERIPNNIHFALDESALISIFYNKVENCGFAVPTDDETFTNTLSRRIRELRFSPEFANARSVINYAYSVVEKARGRDSIEVVFSDLDVDEKPKKNIEQLLAELDTQFVGLRSVKASIREYARNIEVAAFIGDPAPLPPRALFLGNAGTGKSSFAREYARLLREIGCTSSDRFVEIPAVQLKGTHVGVAQDNVVKAFRDARGGMLFIDEIYALRTGSDGDPYAADIVDALVGQTELPQNERTAIVLAGYEIKTLRWLDSNQGLNRRFPQRVHFTNYRTEDCIEIFLNAVLSTNSRRHLPGLGDVRVPVALKREIDIVRRHEDEFANAATIMELVSFVTSRMYARVHKTLHSDDVPGTREFVGITADDIIKGAEEWREHFELKVKSNVRIRKDWRGSE